MIVFGFILLLIELFLIPGVNIFGIVGALSIIGGIVYSYFLNPAWALYTFLGSVFLSGLIVRLVTKSKTWNMLIQTTREDLLEGYRATKEDLEFLKGKTGYTLTNLRPSGTAIIDEKRVDVVSESVYIKSDVKIKVIDVEGNKVLVRPITDEELEELES
jgi:membrane-bound serine protease (ClpP class)